MPPTSCCCDLAVWYHLAWLGESVRRDDPRVAALVAKGRGFDAADRRLLLELDRRAAGRHPAALPRARRCRPLRTRRVALQPSDPAAAVRFRRRARIASRMRALPRTRGYPGGAERAAWHLARRVRVLPSACSASRRAAAGRRRARSATPRSAPSRRRASTGWPRASACCAARSNVGRRHRRTIRARRSAQLNRAFARAGRQRCPASSATTSISDLIGFSYSQLAWRRCRARISCRKSRRSAERTRRRAGARAAGRARWRERLGALPVQRLLFPARAVRRAGRRTRSCGWRRCPRSSIEQRAAGIAPRRCRTCAPAAGCTARCPPGWAIRTRTRGWDLLCEAKRAFDDVVAAGTLDAAQRGARRAAARGLRGFRLVLVVRRLQPGRARCAISTSCFATSSPACIARCELAAAGGAGASASATGRGAPEGGGVMRRA